MKRWVPKMDKLKVQPANNENENFRKLVDISSEIVIKSMKR